MGFTNIFKKKSKDKSDKSEKEKEKEKEKSSLSKSSDSVSSKESSGHRDSKSNGSSSKTSNVAVVTSTPSASPSTVSSQSTSPSVSSPPPSSTVTPSTSPPHRPSQPPLPVTPTTSPPPSAQPTQPPQPIQPTQPITTTSTTTTTSTPEEAKKENLENRLSISPGASTTTPATKPTSNEPNQTNLPKPLPHVPTPQPQPQPQPQPTQIKPTPTPQPQPQVQPQPTQVKQPVPTQPSQPIVKQTPTPNTTTATTTTTNTNSATTSTTPTNQTINKQLSSSSISSISTPSPPKSPQISHGQNNYITAAQKPPSCSNLTDDVERKKAEKYDKTLEQTARKWVEDVLGLTLDESKSFQELFKSGVLLCRLVNELKPNSVRKVNESTISFKQLENIENYLKACKALGLSSHFNSIDLFEAKDINLVINQVVVLGKFAARVEGYTGVHLAGEKKNIKITTTPVSPLFGTKPTTFTAAAVAAAAGGASTEATPTAITVTTKGGKVKWRKSVKIPTVSSLNTDINTKEAFKYSPELQKAAQDWIEEVLQEKFKHSNSFAMSLKDGVLLCKVVNKIKPSTIIYINTSQSSFKQIENIANYLIGCTTIGLKKTDLFDATDLFEEKNLNLVISNIHVLANHTAKNYPELGLPAIKQVKSNSSADSSSTTLKLYSSLVHSKFGTDTSTTTTSNALPDDYQTLVQWLNYHLKTRQIEVKDIGNDLRNGVYILVILEELTNQRVGIYSKDPILPWHYMQNIFLILSFLRENSLFSVGEISPHDIFNGDKNTLCRLIRLIRDSFDRDFYFRSIPVDNRRQTVMEEIVTTEQFYVKSLKIVYKSLISPLIKSLSGDRDNNDKIILPMVRNKEEIYSIFGNWQFLLESHQNLLGEFEDRMEAWDTETSTVGDIFLEKCEFLKEQYKAYIDNYDNSYTRIKRLRKGNPLFDELINKFEVFQDSTNGLDLYSYLIMPIQRIPRYLLLLKELIKYTDKTHPDFGKLHTAKDMIRIVADSVNESKMLANNKRKLDSIQESIWNIPIQLNDPEVERKYIREGFLEIEDTFNKDSYFFLFNDLLLFAKYKPSEETGKEFKFKEIFYLSQVLDILDILSDDEDDEIEDGGEDSSIITSPKSLSSSPQEELFKFEIETNEFSLILVAETQNEKIEWMDSLKSCIQNHLIHDEDEISDLSHDDEPITTPKLEKNVRFQ